MMNRRKFLEGAAVSLIANRAVAQTTPRPPTELSVDGEPPPPPSDTNGSLRDALMALSPGADTEFTPSGWSSDNTVRGFALNWQTRGFYDEARQEVRFVGKAQQSVGGEGSHWVYDVAQNRLSVARVTAWGGESGHLYDAPTYDESTGELYWARYNSRQVRRWRQGAALTTFEDDVTSDPSGGIGSIMAGGKTFASSGEVASAWHPSLYGPGDPGLVVMCNDGIGAWRKSTDAWAVLVDYAAETSATVDRAVCLYVRGLNAVVATIGTELKAWRIDIGPTASAIDDTPINFGHGHGGAVLLDDPDGEAACYAFEKTKSSTRRVWKYNAGVWYQIAGYSHPFRSSDSDAIVWVATHMYGMNGWWAFERNSGSVRGRLLRKATSF